MINESRKPMPLNKEVIEELVTRLKIFITQNIRLRPLKYPIGNGEVGVESITVKDVKGNKWPVDVKIKFAVQGGDPQPVTGGYHDREKHLLRLYLNGSYTPEEFLDRLHGKKYGTVEHGLLAVLKHELTHVKDPQVKGYIPAPRGVNDMFSLYQYIQYSNQPREVRAHLPEIYDTVFEMLKLKGDKEWAGLSDKEKIYKALKRSYHWMSFARTYTQDTRKRVMQIAYTALEDWKRTKNGVGSSAKRLKLVGPRGTLP